MEEVAEDTNSLFFLRPNSPISLLFIHCILTRLLVSAGHCGMFMTLLHWGALDSEPWTKQSGCFSHKCQTEEKDLFPIPLAAFAQRAVSLLGLEAMLLTHVQLLVHWQTRDR